MKTKHTPGPWRTMKTSGFIVRDQQWTPIQTEEYAFDVQYPPCVSKEIAQANARLIAAAPDLLAALQGLRAFGGDGGTDADDACRAAIAKALGK